MVNDQLTQLYKDLEFEGVSIKLSLEDSSASSGDSDDDEDCEKQHRDLKYDKFVMIYEENAPFPPPIVHNNIKKLIVK